MGKLTIVFIHALTRRKMNYLDGRCTQSIFVQLDYYKTEKGIQHFSSIDDGNITY